MTHPPGNPPSNPPGNPPSGPGRMSDRALIRLFTAVPVVGAFVLAVAAVVAGRG